MKVFIVLIFVFSFFFAKAQVPYVPMTDGDKYWKYTIIGDPNVNYGQRLEGLMGDTIVDGMTYMKYYYFNSSFYDGKAHVKSKSLMALVRDDIPARKVYIKPMIDNAPYTCSQQEYLAFDFSLEQGDTLNECAREFVKPIWDTTAQWGLVDTITTNFLIGKQRRVINTKGQSIFVGLLPGAWHLNIVEGMGVAISENNVFGLFKYSEQGNYQIAAKYCEGSWEECHIISSSHDVLSRGQVELSPNPVGDYLTVSLPNVYGASTTISFYDLTGRFLRKQRVLPGRNILTISTLPQGVIFYTILSKKGILKNGKLIKN